jgi:GntR family transcriptional regulator
MRLALRPVKRGRGPVHTQIEAALAGAMTRLASGTRLPPERELARRLRVSRMTVRHALASLERRGLVARRVGRGGGTFVAEPKLELSGLAALSDQLRGLGRVAGARVVSVREEDVGPEELGGGPSYEIVRVRLADGAPVALERTWFPADAFPGLLDGPLEGSLYDLIRARYADMPVRVTERLEPTLAGVGDAHALGVNPGEPLMRVERMGYAASGRPVEFSHDLFRGDRVRVVWTSDLP